MVSQSRSEKEIKEALRGLSDQYLAPETADVVYPLLTPEAREALDNLGYEVPDLQGDVSGVAVKRPLIALFVDRIIRGEEITDPVDLEFYENNKEEIEALLREKAAQPETPPVSTYVPFPQTLSEKGANNQSPEEIDRMNSILPKRFTTVMPDGTELEMTLVGATSIFGNWRITYRYPLAGS